MRTKKLTTAERLAKMIGQLDAVLALDKPHVYCVECGAETELECICDELNHDDYPCSEANRI